MWHGVARDKFFLPSLLAQRDMGHWHGGKRVVEDDCVSGSHNAHFVLLL